MTFRVTLPVLGGTDAWRVAARMLATHRVSADQVEWSNAESLFAAEEVPSIAGPHPVTVPKSFPDLCSAVLCHKDPAAPSLAYEALLRHQDNRTALANPADPLTRRLDRLAKAVRRDVHKMHAFVRFREIAVPGTRRRFGAWFEPEHAILELATPFFARRFADMDWTICTPQGVADFVAGTLSFHPATEPPDLAEDASEALWGTYFANIFNPARIKLHAMRSEMPLKYWKNLPETRLIPEMLAAADGRVRAMHDAMPTVPPARAARIVDRLNAPLPEDALTLHDAELLARGCTRCPLAEAATRTVWGEGDPTAPLMIVGEQPGDSEDLSGRPFVGPAGQLLRGMIDELQLGPVWLTNAVKHFKFTPRGKRRLHVSPNRSEIDHCRWWLDTERKFVAPRLTVALGASAAYALTGNRAAMGARRGRIEAAQDGGDVLISWHPSFILRLPDADAGRARAELRGDLIAAARRVSAGDAPNRATGSPSDH